LIVEDIVMELHNGRVPIVLSDRKDQLIRSAG
jgi:hypothetical protein